MQSYPYNKFFRALYRDKCDILRYEQFMEPATGETKLRKRLVYKDIPCRVSRKGSRKSYTSIRDKESYHALSYEIKVFLEPDIEIHAGDMARVRSFSTEHRFKAAEPTVFETHQEVILHREEGA